MAQFYRINPAPTVALNAMNQNPRRERRGEHAAHRRFAIADLTGVVGSACSLDYKSSGSVCPITLVDDLQSST
jgi:hypothetical protein